MLPLVDVPGYEGRYAVDEDGNVYSFAAKKYLRPGRQSSGHMSVYAAGRSRLVHHLVLETFVGPRPAGMETRHLNGNPGDNRLSNLVWGSRRRNKQDIKWHGGCGGQKLDPSQAAAFKRRLLAGEHRARCAAAFGVSEQLAYAVLSGRVHGDV